MSALLRAKPKVGLLLLRAEWFDSVVALPELVAGVAEDTARIVASLGDRYELRVWVVNTAASQARAEAALRAAELDLVVLVFQVWAEDWYLAPLVRAIGAHALLVWCYQPWQRPPRPAAFVDVLRGSGPVGTLEGLGTLRNLGVPFTFAAGAPADPRVQQAIAQAAQVAQTRRALQRAQFGIMPYRNDQMQSTFVDEFRLRHDLGPTVTYLSVGEVAARGAALDEADVAAFVAELRRSYAVRGVRDGTLATAARASLGLATLAAERGLDLLSFNDIAPEVHRVLGLRPCLYPPLLQERGVLVGMEGDLGAATAMFMLDHLAASPVLFAEMWYWDEIENVIVLGHAGPQNPALADKVWITHDDEFAQSDRTEGAHLQFIARGGRVTLLQLRGTPTGWQAIVVCGESLGGEVWLHGYPHAAIKLDVPVPTWLAQVAAVGSTQHWAVAYGDVMAQVTALCALLGVPLLRVA